MHNIIINNECHKTACNKTQTCNNMPSWKLMLLTTDKLYADGIHQLADQWVAIIEVSNDQHEKLNVFTICSFQTPSCKTPDMLLLMFHYTTAYNPNKRLWHGYWQVCAPVCTIRMFDETVLMFACCQIELQCYIQLAVDVFLSRTNKIHLILIVLFIAWNTAF